MGVENAPKAMIYLVEHSDTIDPFRPGVDRWPLACVEGGVDKMTADWNSNTHTLTVKIISPDGGTFLDEGGWARPKRGWRSPPRQKKKAEPR